MSGCDNKGRIRLEGTEVSPSHLPYEGRMRMTVELLKLLR
jgi:hypothetical protein